MGKLLDLFARPRAFKLCTIHPRWTRGRFLGTTESTLWHTEIFGDFLPVTWYLQMNFRYWYDRIDVFICLHIFIYIYIHICMYTLWWLPKYPSCLILVIQSDITQLVQVSIGRSSHARSAPCAWWVYPTATTFRKARHHRSCYVRRAMWWMVVIQGVGESGEGWFGERVGWGWWMVDDTMWYDEMWYEDNIICFDRIDMNWLYSCVLFHYFLIFNKLVSKARGCWYSGDSMWPGVQKFCTIRALGAFNATKTHLKENLQLCNSQMSQMPNPKATRKLQTLSQATSVWVTESAVVIRCSCKQLTSKPS